MPGFLGSESSFSERFGKPILSNRDGKSKNNEAGTCRSNQPLLYLV
jgi:TATA-binding protein-associated factor